MFKNIFWMSLGVILYRSLRERNMIKELELNKESAFKAVVSPMSVFIPDEWKSSEVI